MASKKKIILTVDPGINFDGVIFVVDKEVYDEISSYSWSLNNGYARAKIEGKNIYLHRFLTKAQKGEIVDHIDGDPTNNRLSNLRVTNLLGNAQNSKKKSHGKTSTKKGVGFVKSKGKYRAQIMCDGTIFHLGYFETEDEAARVYDSAAIKLHGDFAHTNGTNANEDVRLKKTSFNEIKKFSSSRSVGVDFVHSRKKWRARYKNKQIGYFLTEQEAINAREEYICQNNER